MIVGNVNHGGGVLSKTRRRPHEPDVCLPECSPLLGELEAHARTVQGPCRPRLDGLPLPRSARLQTKREARDGMFKHGLYVKEAVQERRLLRELLRMAPPSTALRDATAG